MEKKAYIAPETTVVTVALQQMMAGSGDSIHTDDPQNPSSSMSRRNDWDDEEDF